LTNVIYGRIIAGNTSHVRRIKETVLETGLSDSIGRSGGTDSGGSFVHTRAEARRA